MRRRGGGEWGESNPFPSQLRGLGECRELPQRGPGQSRGKNTNLVHSKHHRTLLYVIVSKMQNYNIQCPPNFPKPFSPIFLRR